MMPDSCQGLFTETEWEIICKLAHDEKSHKRIAVEMEMPLGTVNRRVKEISEKIPGGARPTIRITTWFWHVNQGSTQATDLRQEEGPQAE